MNIIKIKNTRTCGQLNYSPQPSSLLLRSIAALFVCVVMYSETAEAKPPLGSVELLETQAHEKETNHNYAAAIAIYDRLLTIQPNHRGAKRGRILALLRLGAPHQALRLAHNNRDLFSPDEWQKMVGDQAAEEIRWGRLATIDPGKRYQDTDSAIKRLQEQYVKITDKASSAALRNRFDLIAAYHNRRYMHKATALYEQLSVKTFPPYVQAIVGDAYLMLRQPERATTLLEQSLKNYPENLDAQYSLYYAYLESGRYKKSLAHIDAFAASLPQWIWPPGSKERQLNIDKLYAQNTASIARAYVGKLDTAEYGLKRLLKQSPANVDIRNNLANIYLWRGWPRLALKEYRSVLAQNSGNLGALKGIVSALTARGDSAGADMALAPLQTLYGDDPSIQNLVRESKIQKMREIWLEVNGGSSSGTNIDKGNKDLGFITYYYDRPWSLGLRPFAYISQSQADFSGQKVNRNRLAIGLHYQQQDIMLRGNISGGDGSPGISLQGDWTPTDHWYGSLSMKSFSEQTPLRADLDNIEAWSLAASTEYRFHESRSLGISLQHMGFDDGNKRNTFFAFGRQRLFQGLHYKLEGELNLYSQTNTSNNTIYFNPATQSSIELEFNNEWLTYRYYEKSMRQRLLINMGSSNQKNFNKEPTWMLGYEHHWSFSQQLSLSYGIKRSRPVYDGVKEYFTRGFMNFYVRF